MGKRESHEVQQKKCNVLYLGRNNPMYQYMLQAKVILGDTKWLRKVILVLYSALVTSGMPGPIPGFPVQEYSKAAHKDD